MILFIWDFHGVLEKDNEKGVMIISNEVLKLAGFKEELSEEDNEKFLGLKWYQYFENLIPRLSYEECLKLQSDCLEYSRNHPEILPNHIKANDHAIEVLDKIAKSGNKQIIISNTRPNDLIWFLETIDIGKFFDEESSIGVNAHQTHASKIDAAKSYIANKKIDKIIVIGDSESDLELGRSIGAVNYFYKHPHRKHEPTQKADYITNDLRDVLKELI